VGDVKIGLQLLERARGVVWSQLLQLRDPKLQDVPSSLASELYNLLRKFNTYRTSGYTSMNLSKVDPMKSFVQERDVQHADHARIQRLIREIRSLPGLENFMYGPTLEALRSTATTHPVVVLVANQDCQALIIRSTNAPLTSISLKHVHISELQGMIKNAMRTCMAMVPDSTIVEDDGSRTMKSRQPREMLATLWFNVVKPVINHLGLRVSRCFVHIRSDD
jgi:hypothetical protein